MTLVAKFLLFLEIVLLAIVLGAVATFFGVIGVSLMLGVSGREGALAMGAVGLAPIGAAAGAALGVWVGWRLISTMRPRSIQIGGYGLLCLGLLSVAGWFVYQDLSDGDPYPPDQEPMVVIEWRLPTLVPHEQIYPVYRFTLRSSYMDWPLTTKWDDPRFRDDDGHTILRFRGFIRWRVTGRTFELWRAPAHDNRIKVDLGMPRDPAASADFSPWLTVPTATDHAVRYRVIGDAE